MILTFYDHKLLTYFAHTVLYEYTYILVSKKFNIIWRQDELVLRTYCIFDSVSVSTIILEVTFNHASWASARSAPLRAPLGRASVSSSVSTLLVLCLPSCTSRRSHPARSSHSNHPARWLSRANTRSRSSSLAFSRRSARIRKGALFARTSSSPLSTVLQTPFHMLYSYV